MSMKPRKKNIVVIGGGTGSYTVLSGLKKYPVNLTAIVSMADDGGSTRVLREEFGVLPPGSVRPAMVALSSQEETLAKLFSFRFSQGTLAGHNFGNLFLVALTKQLGSFEEAVERAAELLHLKGEVVPSTLQKVTLYAKLENNAVIKGEANIDVPKHNGNLRIKKVWLEPKAKANPRALKAIRQADLIVIGPGDLYTSIIPNFLVQGIGRAVEKSKAKKVYVCNIMTKFGETTGFCAKDFVDVLERYLGKDVFDYIVVNIKRPDSKRIKEYGHTRARFVEYSPEDSAKAHFSVLAGDFVRKAGFIRHDSDKLAKLLFSLVASKKQKGHPYAQCIRIPLE